MTQTHIYSGYHRATFGGVSVRTDSVKRIRQALESHGLHRIPLVGTGVSGTVLPAIVAHLNRVPFICVRKDNDGSHATTKIEGWPTGLKQYLIIDDFPCSERTLKRVLSRMREQGAKLAANCPGKRPEPECVGVLFYCREDEDYLLTADGVRRRGPDDIDGPQIPIYGMPDDLRVRS